MNTFTRFWHGIQQEIKAFFFFTALIMIFRFAFIGIFSSQLAAPTMLDYMQTFWFGLRLSLKTVSGIILLGIIFAFLPSLIFKKWPAEKFRLCIYSILTCVLTVLFCLRLPYYKIFNASYNIMILNGLKDDATAILETGIYEYGLLYYSIGAIMLSIFFCYLLIKFLRCPTIAYAPTKKAIKLTTYIITFLGFAILAPFLRFGGAFTYEQSINWEKAARLSSNLLNEAVLDDVQAMYRVKSIYDRIQKNSKITFTATELRQKIKALGGNENADTIDEAFQHKVTQPLLTEQPKSVYFILGETYALWPFLPEFKEIGDYTVSEGKRLLTSPQSMSTQYLLANGNGTISGLNGFITGMQNINVSSNYTPLTYKESYDMGIGAIMKKAGYKTVFWYGGYGTWQNIRTYTLAQNFDEYHDASEMQSDGGNAWGVPDKDLFKAIESYMANHKGEKIFNFILTTSNHPPYNINLAAEGFDANLIHGHIPDLIANTPTQVKEIGHYWYQDQVIGHFITAIEKIDSSAIFAITGDHSERFTFTKEVDARISSSIPAIFYGHGIQKSWMPNNQYGVGYQIIPTLARLITPAGQSYSSIYPDLLTPHEFAFNHELYLDETGYHKQEQMNSTQKEKMQLYRDVTLWRLTRGNRIQ